MWLQYLSIFADQSYIPYSYKKNAQPPQKNSGGPYKTSFKKTQRAKNKHDTVW